MREMWTAECVGRMHLHEISQTEVADRLGYAKGYINSILCGRRKPKGAQQLIENALDELIKERENEP